jgi:hypothetical protein
MSPNQRGSVAIEFSLLLAVFLGLVFGILETSRLLYVFNTLQEVTRRAAAAAAVTYPTDTSAIDKLKQQAVFRSTSGPLMFAPPVTDQYVRLSYLAYDLSVIPQASWPASAAKNRLICAGNPHAANCIRFVQAQVCAPDDTDTCTAVTSRGVFPLVNLTMKLHKATTITVVEVFGYVPGTPPPCPCS